MEVGVRLESGAVFRDPALLDLPVPVFVIDDDGRMHRENHAFAALFPGREPDELPAALADIVVSLAALAVAPGPDPPRTRVRELTATDAEGVARVYQVTMDRLSRPLAGPQGGWIGSLAEITNVRHAERTFRASLATEKFLAGMLTRFVAPEDLDAAIQEALADLARFTGAYRTFLAILRCDDQICDRAYEYGKDDAEPVMQKLIGRHLDEQAWWADQLRNGEALDVPDIAELPAPAIQFIRALGGRGSGSLLIIPLEVSGELAGFVGAHHADVRKPDSVNDLVLLDIFCHILERVIQNQRKDLALEQYMRQLRETSGQLVQSEKMASIGQIAAGVAHEINNPIGFIMSNLSTLQDYTTSIRGALSVCRALIGVPTSVLALDVQSRLTELENQDLEFIDGDIDGLLAESLEGCERVRDIVINLKGFARPDESKPRSFGIDECVESTLKIVWNELKYRCQVVKDYGDVPPLTGYPGQINQVIMNLLVNAAHAIETEGVITITTRATLDEAILSVADTGSGIPTENIPHLFEPFFTTKAAGKGTGLGLYICHGIVENHGGRIEVESHLGLGTTIRVHLPLADDGEELFHA